MARAPQMTRQDQRSGTLTTAVGSGGEVYRAAAHVFGSLSGQLQQIDQIQRAERDRKAKAQSLTAAQKKGAAGGKAALSAGALTLLPDDSDENRAHNAALTRSYFREVELAGRKGLADIEAQWSHDPSEMEARMTAFAQGFRGGVPAELQTDMDILLEDVARPYLREARRAQRIAVIEADKAEANELIETRLAGLDRMAFLSDLDPASDEAIAGQIEGLTELLVQQGPKTAFSLGGVDYPADPGRTGVMSPEAITTQIQDATDRAGIRRIEGYASRLETEDEQRDFLAQLETEFKAGTGVIGTLNPDQYQDVRTTLIRSLDGFARARREKATQVRAQIRDAQAVVSNGLNPGADLIRSLRAQALQTGDLDLVQDVATLEGHHRFAQTLERQTPTELRAFIEGIRGSGRRVSRAESERVRMAEQYLTGMERDLSRDPLGFVVASGRSDVPALDFDSDDLDGLAMQRKFQALMVADEFGIDPPLLRPDEKRDLTNRLRAGGAEALGTVQDVMRAFGDDAMTVLSQVSDDAPVMAHVAGLANQGFDPVFIEDAALGLELQGSEGFKSRLPERADIEAAVDSVFDTAFAAMPKAATAVRDSALAALEARAVRQGETIDKGAIEDMLETALGRTSVNRSMWPGSTHYGGTTRVRGRTVIAPSWLQANKLDELVDRLSDEQWSRAGALGKPVDVMGRIVDREDLRDLHLTTIGNGRYRVSFNDPFGSDPQYLLDSEGRPYVLDLDAIEPSLRQDTMIRKWIKGAE